MKLLGVCPDCKLTSEGSETCLGSESGRAVFRGVKQMAVREVLQSPELPAQPESAMNPQIFYYSPLRYLRTILAIAWSAFTHPFSSTVIDLATGQVHHEGREEKE